MLLRLTHTTDLVYSDLISESAMELRMAPRQEDDQHRLSFTLAIGPTAPATSYFDWLGNTVHAFTGWVAKNRMRRSSIFRYFGEWNWCRRYGSGDP